MTTRQTTDRPDTGIPARHPVHTTAFRILLVGLTATLITGCRAHVQVRGPRVRPRARISVTATHVHGVTCGHAWGKGRWIVVGVGHHHHGGCGHFFYDKRWHVTARASATIKVGPVVVTIKQGHRHSHTCGHFHHNGRWFHLRNHVHRSGCGHRLRGSIWIKF